MDDLTSPDLDLLISQRDWLCRLARRLVGDVNRAEDLAQETFISALRYRPTFGGNQSRARGWLTRVVRNHAVNQKRKSQSQEYLEVQASKPEPIEDRDALELDEAQTALLDCVQALPSEFRSVLLARYYGECSIAQIAEAQGQSQVNIRKRLSRATARLREDYARQNGVDWRQSLMLLASPSKKVWWSGSKAVQAFSVLSVLVTLLTPVGVLLLAQFNRNVHAAIEQGDLSADASGGFDNTSGKPVWDLATPLSTRRDSGRDAKEFPATSSRARSRTLPGETLVTFTPTWRDRTPLGEGVEILVQHVSAGRGFLYQTCAEGVVQVRLPVGIYRVSVQGSEFWHTVVPSDHKPPRSRASEQFYYIEGDGLVYRVGDPSPAERALVLPGVKVEGVLLDQLGRPIPGAAILDWQRSHDNWQMLHDTPRLSATTDHLGRFEVSGAHSLVAFADGFEPSSQVQFDSCRQVAWTVGRSSRVLEINVVDGGGVAIPGAAIHIGDEASSFGGALYETGMQGRMKTDSIGGGAYRISVVAGGFATYYKRTTVPAGETLKLVVPMERELPVHGIVRDAEGVPAERVLVHQKRGKHWGRPKAYTDEEGRFVLHGLGSRDPEVQVEQPDTYTLEILETPE